MKIAVLNGDATLSKIVCSVLSSGGHSVHPLNSAKEILHSLHRTNADMLIFDWQAPNLNGADVIHQVKEKFSPTFPILFMTSRFGEDDIVAGLAAGADDYMIKPLRRHELVTRVQTLLRQAYPNQLKADPLEFGPYVFITRPPRASLSGQLVALTQKEFNLALFLFHNLGRPLSRATILDAIWSQEPEIPSRTLDTHISRVRNKLQLRPENGLRLVPVYGYGYQLEQIDNQ